MAANSPSLDIAGILVSQGLGTIGVEIFIGTMPSSPNLCLAVYDTPGNPPNAKWLRDEPTIQINIRGNPGAYQGAWTFAQQVKDVLLGLAPQLIGGINYALFVQIGEIFSDGPDINNRPKLITQWQLVREYSSGGNRVPL